MTSLQATASVDLPVQLGCSRGAAGLGPPPSGAGATSWAGPGASAQGRCRPTPLADGPRVLAGAADSGEAGELDRSAWLCRVSRSPARSRLQQQQWTLAHPGPPWPGGPRSSWKGGRGVAPPTVPRPRRVLLRSEAAEGGVRPFHRRPWRPLCRRVLCLLACLGSLGSHSGRQRRAGLGGDPGLLESRQLPSPLHLLVKGTPQP